MIALMAIGMAFVACKKDDVDSSRVIDAKNVFSSVNISSVEARLAKPTGGVVNLATADYKNASFKLTLPKTVSEDALAGDASGKLGIITIDAFYGNMVGSLFLVDATKNIQVSYIYANKDFKVNDTFVDEENPEEGEQIWNCSFKKGWNMVYAQISKNEVTINTTQPSGLNLLCYCIPNSIGPDKSMPFGEKSIQNIMKNFSTK